MSAVDGIWGVGWGVEDSFPRDASSSGIEDSLPT